MRPRVFLNRPNGDSQPPFAPFRPPPLRSKCALAARFEKRGALVVIDFERIEGKWTMGHVRAGKEVFRKEIEDAGLTFVEEVKLEGLKENYFLRFRKE